MVPEESGDTEVQLQDPREVTVTEAAVTGARIVKPSAQSKNTATSSARAENEKPGPKDLKRLRRLTCLAHYARASVVDAIIATQVSHSGAYSIPVRLQKKIPPITYLPDKQVCQLCKITQSAMCAPEKTQREKEVTCYTYKKKSMKDNKKGIQLCAVIATRI